MARRHKALMKKRKKKPRKAFLRPSEDESEDRRWILVIDSKEAAVNFYSILLAFQRSNGGGLINKEALKYVAKWMNVILKHDPDVVERANDSRGPFRARDLSPLDISIQLNRKERAIMLLIWQTLLNQLMTPTNRANWIENQGLEDYELAVKYYKAWIDSLQGEGYAKNGN